METALLMKHAALQRAVALKSSRARWPARSCAAFVAWLWSRYGYRVNLSRFFQVTAVFLLVFVVQLFIYGFHELDRGEHHPATASRCTTRPSRSVPTAVYGQYLTYLLVVLPVGWLAVSSLFHRSQPQRSMTA